MVISDCHIRVNRPCGDQLACYGIDDLVRARHSWANENRSYLRLPQSQGLVPRNRRSTNESYVYEHCGIGADETFRAHCPRSTHRRPRLRTGGYTYSARHDALDIRTAAGRQSCRPLGNGSGSSAQVLGHQLEATPSWRRSGSDTCRCSCSVFRFVLAEPCPWVHNRAKQSRGLVSERNHEVHQSTEWESVRRFRCKPISRGSHVSALSVLHLQRSAWPTCPHHQMPAPITGIGASTQCSLG